MDEVPNEIFKSIRIAAPLAAVWDAIGDASHFASWIGLDLDSEFVVGEPVRGSMAPTAYNETFKEQQEEHEGLRVCLWIEEITPPSRFSFSFHPFAIDPKHDYSTEPRNHVFFVLAQHGQEVEVTVNEIGFNQIPEYRRRDAYEANDQGWANALTALSRYVLQVRK